MTNYDHRTFISPFTWRYGSEEMRYIWSEVYKRRLMRRVWVALAAAQHVAGLVSAEQLADLDAHAEDVNIERALQIERETRHDVMAEIRAYAEQCPIGGGIIHWGATSADITDNVDVLRQREATRLLIEGLHRHPCHPRQTMDIRGTNPAASLKARRSTSATRLSPRTSAAPTPRPH